MGDKGNQHENKIRIDILNPTSITALDFTFLQFKTFFLYKEFGPSLCIVPKSRTFLL